MITEIEPKMGEQYLLRTSETSKSKDSFNGFYIGKNLVGFPEKFESSKPEGHVFVNLKEEGQIEIYCTRTSKKTLNFLYYSDGEDGPEWPAGFWVEKVGVKLSKLEEQYLINKINDWKGIKKAA